MTSEWKDTRPGAETWTPGSSHWRVTLRISHENQPTANGAVDFTVTKKRRFTTWFSMGPALSGEPKVTEVLDCLLSDAQAGSQDFSEFCGEFGYDEDSRKAEKTWKECAKTHERLTAFLGDELFEKALYAERP